MTKKTQPAEAPVPDDAPALNETQPEAPGLAPDLNAEFAALEAEAGSVPGGDPAAPAGTGPDLPTKDVVAMALAPMFAILAPGWGVTQEEVGTLAEAYAPVIDKYFPDMAMGPELTAVLATALVLGPRIGRPRKIEPPAEEQERAQQQAAA